MSARAAFRLIARVALLVAIVLVVACTRGRTRGQKMTIGVSTLRISMPVFVAANHGLFAKHGLDVDLRRFDTAQPLADELAAGRLDAGGYVAFPILFAPGAPPPRLRVITAVVEDATHPLSFLLVKKGSRLRGVAALKGKRIGILPTIAYRRWLEAILAHDGIGANEVTIMPIAPALEADALAGGGIDALFTGDPMATAALTRGVAELASETPDVPRVLGDPFLFGTFAVSEDFATKRASELAALREALDEAIDWMAKDPTVGPTAMASYVRETEHSLIERYPPARYLRSTEVRVEQLDRALELCGSASKGAQIAAP